ncbi:MAG: hypothetical protein K2Q34_02530, partial [Alphaproteobacteria bacterium]|nr:hypothetical protein [Alphaproteobacteria bacterium]
ESYSLYDGVDIEELDDFNYFSYRPINTLEELEEALDKKLPLNEHDEEDIDTLGGLVAFLAGRVPIRGELVTHPSGIEFEVLDADARRVKRLCLRKLP